MSAGAVQPSGALAGKVVLLTGATGGFGVAVAHACADAGASLILCARKVRPLEKLLDALAGNGADATLYPMDLAGASVEDHAEMAQRIEAEFGRLDAVVHMAAHFQAPSPIEYTDPGELARTLHVDLTARIWMTQACLPLLQPVRGRVLFVVDAPERCTGPFWGGYGLAQQAQHALVPMWQAEQGAEGVGMLGLQPGPMRTALRAKVFVEDDPAAASPPARYAGDVVRLLGPAGDAWRGRIERLP